ncbi:uncharacterized protein Z519_05969 [Cladophialophora bantiana CBS 173.52]|uniref:Zn(2)-C6 fungal-type domain-containing protein n=1 Tax=Cladophialophora bantiana (strain ATCC 10958 / CBS 173.52 / CDC B-1940 / NIH 8579) TaxID=1442370 RepID=A0A0D2I9A9_CLAB1|nr:uncharacterized protein Z519_05969 [Cladophialophora bantiana CBS 173.52]KIW93364.1 hypothetical protein Z519_05969 [Cladophialophora bantiana CBS 173.52]
MRRKKCNEGRPRCEKCIKSNRVCTWPAEDDLFDRRHSRASRSPTLPPPGKSPESIDVQGRLSNDIKDSTRADASPFFICREISFNSDLFNSPVFKSDLEVDCFRHFLDGFLPLLILSNTHPGFQSQFIPEVVEMLLQFEGMRDIALACGASRMHLLTGNVQMNEVGIRYYARAVSEVNRSLSMIDWGRDDFNDALLVAIIFLYIHGVFSIGTNKDIGKHVMGAIQLMKLRCTHSRRPPMPRPIHRIIWESILYQVFRQTVNRPFAVDFQPDFEFCARAEETLQSLTFPDASAADNSPVIGFPLALQKLIIEIVQLCKSPAKPEPELLEVLGRQLGYWEQTILEEGHCVNEEDSWLTKTPAERARIFHQHSTSLHILAASLLLDWVSRSHEVYETESPLPPAGDTWQVRRGLEIMQCPQANEEWSRCYLGSWPTLIFGYAVDKPEDIALIRNDLRQRFHKLYSGEELLFLEELESVWRTRGVSYPET